MKKIWYYRKYYWKTAFRKNIAFSARIQSFLQVFGIAIHNPWRDECCCDFECCSPSKEHRCWFHINSKSLLLRRVVWYEDTAPKGTAGRDFIKKTKLVFQNPFKK